MKKVIIDVDTGIDDALALIVGVKSNKLDILGVTTVAGNIPVELSTSNTLKVLKLLGREDIEVYEGASKPLDRNVEFHDSVHGEGGIAGQLKEMKTKTKQDIHAVDYMIDEINKQPGEITLIMLGPLTNLALALKKDSSIVEKIKEVYIMGGAVRVPGNVSPVAEFNFYVDPQSAYNVLHSGLNIKLIGLDVTNHARLAEDDLKNIDTQNEYGKFLVNVSNFYIERSALRRKDRSCALHDPVVVAAAINEDILTYEKCFVDVEYSSRISDGQSIGYFGRKGYTPNVELGVSLDKDKFKDIFLDVIS